MRYVIELLDANYTDNTPRFWWRVVSARNKQVILTSEIYSRKYHRNQAVAKFRKLVKGLQVRNG